MKSPVQTKNAIAVKSAADIRAGIGTLTAAIRLAAVCVTVLALTLTFTLAAAFDVARAETPQTARFDNLGKHHRAIKTSSTDAQAWFDQGFNLYFGFNHEEAVRSFEAVAKSDPDCAMAYWGIAMSYGPNINNPVMDEPASQAAYDALQEAIKRRDNASDVERALIDALATRYTWPAPEERAQLDQAYADAMAEVWKRYPKDADVGALYAESLMDLRPWDLWTAEGDATPGTMHIVETLETVLAMVPEHPGACHFYIHTMEASPMPEKALPAANRLRTLVPGAGHLVHMPGHIDLRLGDYDRAVIANQHAIEADRKYVEATGHTGFYTLYRAHNYHFLAYAAMFEGRKELSVAAAREMIDEVPLDMVRAFPDFLDAFIAVPIHVMVRFGMWKELLAEPAPPEDLLAATAFWYYGRTVANASLGNVKDGEVSLQQFKDAAAKVPETRTLGNNSVEVLLEIGLLMAEGELEYRRGNYNRAFELLRDAVEKDVALKYDEPWGWMQPVRHALGALLLEQNQLVEAEQVYRADLELHPENGWALYGLQECLERRGKAEEAQDVAVLFKERWARADISIKASCYCSRKM
jgi:tetratricopeptide (TPR) repeat protein